jgi:hypothetical protein
VKKYINKICNDKEDFDPTKDAFNLDYLGADVVTRTDNFQKLDNYVTKANITDVKLIAKMTAIETSLTQDISKTEVTGNSIEKLFKTFGDKIMAFLEML